MKFFINFNIFKTVIYYTSILSIICILHYLLTYNYYPSNKININNRGFLWLIILFGAPIFEELVFRYPLKYPKYYFFILFVIIYFFVSSTYRSNIFFFGILLICAIFFLLVNVKTPKIIEAFFKKHFVVFFVIFNIIFSMLHLYNFELEGTKKAFYIILILPQFLSGLLFGYFRMKFGFFWGVFSHFYYNSIILGLNVLI